MTRAWEQDNQNWAKKLIELLEEINRAVNGAGGKLENSESKKYRQKYREILKEAEKESPPPDEAKRKISGDGSKEQNHETFWRDFKPLKRMC